MLARFLVLFLFGALSFGAAAQETLLGSLNTELQFTNRLERLLVVKLAENKISERLKAIFDDPVTKREGPLWGLKVASYSYGMLTLLIEEQYPEVAHVYRERAEMFSDVIRGKLPLEAIVALERANETKKMAVFEKEFMNLKTTSARGKSLFELGARLGDKISAHAKILSSRDK